MMITDITTKAFKNFLMKLKTKQKKRFTKQQRIKKSMIIGKKQLMKKDLVTYQTGLYLLIVMKLQRMMRNMPMTFDMSICLNLKDKK